jgi:uncharacterized phiE125 gp8 family phage protein
MNWDRVTIKTKPADVPVTLAEAKEWCAATDFTDDDDLITSLVESATSKIDGPRGIGIACFTQTWELSLDAFETEIILPGWPVKSVSSVTYVDIDGATQTIDSADYQLDIKGDKVRLRPSYGLSWPTPRLINAAVSISYVVGEAQVDIEPLIKLAIKQMVAHWYENREAISETGFNDVPMSATQIMRDYFRGSIAA